MVKGTAVFRLYPAGQFQYLFCQSSGKDKDTHSYESIPWIGNISQKDDSRHGRNAHNECRNGTEPVIIGESANEKSPQESTIGETRNGQTQFNNRIVGTGKRDGEKNESNGPQQSKTAGYGHGVRPLGKGRHDIEQRG